MQVKIQYMEKDLYWWSKQTLKATAKLLRLTVYSDDFASLPLESLEVSTSAVIFYLSDGH